MALYTSDVDTIYSNILDGTITFDMVRILTSQYPQSLHLLSDFVNIEEILCFIVCPFEKLDIVADSILQLHKLTTVSFFFVFISPSSGIEDSALDAPLDAPLVHFIAGTGKDPETEFSNSNGTSLTRKIKVV